MGSNTTNNRQHGQAVEPLAHVAGKPVVVATNGSSQRIPLPAAATRAVLVISHDADSYVEFGDDTVVANNTSTRYPANMPFEFAVSPNQTHLAVVQVIGAGELRVTPLA